jgi:hypothetical protein
VDKVNRATFYVPNWLRGARSLGLVAMTLSCGARSGLGFERSGGQEAPAGSAVTGVLAAPQELPGTLWESSVERFTCQESVGYRPPCERDEDCCYNSCWVYINTVGQETKQCYGKGPPNAPCDVTHECASGRGCGDCAATDLECRGTCLPSGPGALCRHDGDCIIPPCVPGEITIRGAGLCVVCENDSDCPGSRCEVEFGRCENWRAEIQKFYPDVALTPLK